MQVQKKAELQKQAAQSWQGALKILVNHNPTAVYKYIQLAFPNQFEKMVSGFELNPTSIDKMIGFLSQKASQAKNPTVYVASISTQIPYDKNQTNFTKH